MGKTGSVPCGGRRAPQLVERVFLRGHPVFAALSVLVAVSLIGCHPNYAISLTLTNYYDVPVSVRVALTEYEMAPCSVRGFALGDRGPGVPIEAIDSAGRAITDIEVAIVDEPRLEMLVQIGDETGSTCLPPKMEFKLQVTNWSERGAVYLWLDNVLLGAADTDVPKTIGPVAGNWHRAEEIRLRDQLGQDLAREGVVRDFSPLMYQIGDMPTVVMTIQDDWLTQPTQDLGQRRGKSTP